MKVYKKKFAHRNLLVFILLSVVYLLLIYAFSRGVSFFSRPNLISFVLHNVVVLILSPFVFYSISTFKSYAKYLLSIFFIIILLTSFVLLSASFNKLVLALTFAYALFAFYFFITWDIERTEAGYNPLFSKNDLEKQSRFPIQGRIYNKDRTKNDKIYLTNLDEYSCYVILADASFSKNHAIIEIVFENAIFSSPVVPISQYDQALGFSFLETNQSDWSLAELCKICRQRGLFLVS